MKKKIFSISLIVILVVSSMLLTATPVGAADLAWSSVTVPNPQFSNQVTGGVNDVDVAKVTVAPNGDIFAIDSVTSNTTYKSVNGGYSWIPTTIPNNPAIGLVDIAISPSYETDSTVFAVGTVGGNSRAYISTNGGTSFAVLGGIIDASAARDIAVVPNYAAGNGEVMAATATDVYIWGKNGVLDWVAAGTTAVTAFAIDFSPNYPIDGTRIAIDNGTIHTLVGSDADWDDTLTNATTFNAGVTVSAIGDIAFPSDFNASLPVARTLYYANTGDNVYRAAVGSTTNATSLGLSASPPQSIAYSGTGLSGTLFAGESGTANVWRSDNPSANPATLVAWTPNYGPPSGASTTYVALANDFVNSNMVYAGTADAAAGGNSAFSVSSDRGTYFYQTGLIDTALAGVNDMAYASADEIFLFTNDGGAGSDSLWKSSNGGLTWNRIYSFVATNNTALIELSPDYATDSTLFIGDIGKTGANALLMSNDGGSTFVGRAVPVISVGSIAAKDMYTILIGSSTSGTVQMTANGGWTWQAAATTAVGTAGAITDVDVDPGTGHILVGTDTGNIAYSTNSNVSYLPVGTAAITGGNAIVAFDANYGSNGMVYAATTATTGAFTLSRFQIGTSSSWLAITPTGGAGVRDMIAAPDGTLYFTDNSTTGILYRSINPTAGFPTLSLAEWSNTSPAGGTQLGLFDLLEGSNVIYAVNPAVATGAIVTYTDTLTTAVPEMISPQEGIIISDDTATVLVWGSVPGALSYEYRYGTRADFNSATTTTPAPVAAPFTSGPANLIPGLTYYWQVRVLTPLKGPWSQAQTFQSQLTTGDPNAPGILSPSAGGTGPGGYNASLMPTFQWGTVIGATGYQFQLATDAGMTSLIIDETLDTTAYQAATALNYSTTYYWRVRGMSDTSETAWSPITAFTTMDEPAAPSEGPGTTVIVPTQPAPTINIPTQPAPQITVTTGEGEGVAPGYIWAVIIIGAVLVIALIVLIVRTRRTV